MMEKLISATKQHLPRMHWKCKTCKKSNFFSDLKCSCGNTPNKLQFQRVILPMIKQAKEFNEKGK